MLLFNIEGAKITTSLDHQMSADAHCHPRGTTMTKLIIISTLAAAIALSSVSSTFAAPKQKVQEPIYFTLATGQE